MILPRWTFYLTDLWTYSLQQLINYNPDVPTLALAMGDSPSRLSVLVSCDLFYFVCQALLCEGQRFACDFTLTKLRIVGFFA